MFGMTDISTDQVNRLLDSIWKFVYFCTHYSYRLTDGLTNLIFRQWTVRLSNTQLTTNSQRAQPLSISSYCVWQLIVFIGQGICLLLESSALQVQFLTSLQYDAMRLRLKLPRHVTICTNTPTLLVVEQLYIQKC